MRFADSSLNEPVPSVLVRIRITGYSLRSNNASGAFACSAALHSPPRLISAPVRRASQCATCAAMHSSSWLKLAPPPLRCLRFAARFLADGVRAARSVSALVRNIRCSVLLQAPLRSCGLQTLRSSFACGHARTKWSISRGASFAGSVPFVPLGRGYCFALGLTTPPCPRPRF